MAQAIAATTTLQEAADQVGCTSALIWQRGQDVVEVNRALHEQAVRREDLYAKAIIAHDGVLSKAAKSVGLDSGSALRYHVYRSPRLRAIWNECRTDIVDEAEANVFEDVRAGSIRSSWKLLKTLGKDRGYTERHESDSTVTHTITDQSSQQLQSRLSSLTALHPAAVEAQYKELSESEQALFDSVASKQGPAALPEPAQTSSVGTLPDLTDTRLNALEEVAQL